MLLLTSFVFGQQSLKIGDAPTTIDANAVLELQSTTKGLVLPRVATTSAILSPENGLMVYDISTKCVKSYNNGFWSGCLSGGLNQTSNGTAVIFSIDCDSDPVYNGTISLSQGLDGVVQKVTVVVTAVGTYNFLTNIVNGMYFQLSGTFTTTGSQEITLIGYGSPIVAGNFTYTLNSNPGCTFDRITYYMYPNIVLFPTPYFITSVYDVDYLPYTIPSSVATLSASVAATTGTATNELLPLNIQGSLPELGITIKIPYESNGYGTIVPAFTETITIPAAATKEGLVDRQVKLIIAQATFSDFSSGTISAKLIPADNSIINFKQLDIQTGIGFNNLGYLLGTFSIPTSVVGITTPFELRAIAAIPDRSISTTAATATSHSMFYTPIRSATGRTWLNNNLGADYSNVYKSVFSPAQQATSATDYKAFGSLIQWGRNTDGHELTNWSFTNVILGPAVTIPITAVSTTSTTTNGAFIKNANWLNLTDYSLWQGVDGTNNPCPTGYRVPTTAELGAEMTAASILTTATAYNSIFKFTTTNYRNSGDGVFTTTNNTGYYWASEFSGTSGNKYSISSIVQSSTSARGQGFAVRCIKD